MAHPPFTDPDGHDCVIYFYVPSGCSTSPMDGANAYWLSNHPSETPVVAAPAQQQNTDQNQQNQNNGQNQQNNQDQNQQNQPIQMSGGKGSGQGKGERRQTSKPDNPTKGARPVRDPSGKIIGWRVPTADGKGKVKTLEWGKANGLDPANFRKAGIGAAIVTGAVIVGRAIAGCFESGVCEAIP